MTVLEGLTLVWMLLCVVAIIGSSYLFDEEERKQWHDDE